jgi:HSP20 family protein
MAVAVRRGDTSPDRQARGTSTAPEVWDPFADRAPAFWDDPWEALRSINQRMTNLMESIWRGTPWSTGEGVTPPGELEEHDDAWVVRAELPGVKRGDIEVELAGRRLTVHAERKRTERTGRLRRSTRTTGRFHLETWLPGEPVADKVDATLEDGVLTVWLPKPESERSRRRKIAVR